MRKDRSLFISMLVVGLLAAGPALAQVSGSPTENVPASGEGIIIGGTDTAAPAEDIILGGIDTAAPGEGIIIGGTDTAAPGEGIIVGGWDSLTEVAEGIFMPGGWGLQEDVFGPGGWGLQEGIFSPGGWGLTGLNIENFTSAPSGLGLWWRGVKETVSTALTFDPVRKAELRLKYAEEGMKLAELMAEKAGDDPKMQKRAQQLAERSRKHLEQVEKNRDAWFSADDEKSRQLVGNVVKHQLNREAAMDKIEQFLPEDKLDDFREMRQQGLESGQRLLQALGNENLPQPVQQQLQAIKGRIDAHIGEVRQFQEQKRRLLEDRRAGEEGADEGLKDLRQRRLDAVKNRVQMRQQLRPGIRPPGAQPQPLPPDRPMPPVGGGMNAPPPPVPGVSPDVIDPLR